MNRLSIYRILIMRNKDEWMGGRPTFADHSSCSQNAPEEITAMVASRGFVEVLFDEGVSLEPSFCSSTNSEWGKNMMQSDKRFNKRG